jgi:translocation and assembly module TamB
MGLALQPDTGAPDDLQTLRLGGEWDINSATQLTGKLDIHRERGDLILAGTPPTPLGLSTLQFSAHAAAGKLAAELSVVGTLLGEWNAQVSAPQSPAGAGWPLLPTSPLSGHAHISADNLDWIGAALDGDIKTGGRLTLDADLAGTLAAPRLIGQLKGESLLVALLDQGIRLEQGHSAARCTAARLAAIRRIHRQYPGCTARDRQHQSGRQRQRSGDQRLPATTGSAQRSLDHRLG